jgi:hypothetical protein
METIPPTLSERIDELIAHLEKHGHNVRSEREHSIESHLRMAIRQLGYRPDETKEQRANIRELADQVKRCLAECKGEAPAGEEELIQSFLKTTLSNLKADVAGIGSPAHSNLKNVPKAAALLLLGFFLWLAPSARAQSNPESFNITNVINPLIPIISFPTNSFSTNFVATSFSTNGSTISTNGYYLGSGTGAAIEVRNYAWTGFYFSGLTTASNANGTIVFQLVRAKSYSKPTYATSNFSDFETLPSLTLTVPVPLGTNVPVTWMTNLDENYLKCATFVGIYSMTNTTVVTAGCSNAVAGLTKKILPLALSGGNF